MSDSDSSPKKKDKSKAGGKARGKDRERSRSPSRIRASRGKKASLGEMSIEDMKDRVKKFGKFSIDPKTGVGTLEVVSKRLLAEDIDVVVEVLKRFTEVQHIRLQKCFLTDDTVEKLYEGGLKGLRHLKSLHLSMNMLTERSSRFLIEKFRGLPRQLQQLDLRNNSLTEENAEELFVSFPNLQTLNEIPIYKYKRDMTNTVIDCHGLQLRLPEMKILVCLLHSLGTRCHLNTMDVSNNLISAKGLKLLAEGIQTVPIHALDISHNPCTDDDLDFTGIEALYQTVHRHKHIAKLIYDGVKMPEKHLDSLECSLQVNTQLLLPPKNEDGVIKDKFATFIYGVVAERTHALPQNIYKDMEFDLAVDKTFCRLNRVPKVVVKMHKFNRAFDLLLQADERQKSKHEY